MLPAHSHANSILTILTRPIGMIANKNQHVLETLKLQTPCPTPAWMPDLSHGTGSAPSAAHTAWLSAHGPICQHSLVMFRLCAQTWNTTDNDVTWPNLQDFKSRKHAVYGTWLGSLLVARNYTRRGLFEDRMPRQCTVKINMAPTATTTTPAAATTATKRRQHHLHSLHPCHRQCQCQYHNCFHHRHQYYVVDGVALAIFTRKGPGNYPLNLRSWRCWGRRWPLPARQLMLGLKALGKGVGASGFRFKV